MHMQPVNSSNLEAVGYDSSSSTLRIRFHSGTYDYHGVPASIYQGLMNASSKGEYHHAFIKNAFRFTKF